MKFKELRDLIYSPCKVIVGDETYDVQTHGETKFDNLEVIGIRPRLISTFYIEVLLK